jgi:plasmid replication initiation protein
MQMILPIVIQEKTELIKHTAIIHIKSDLSLIDRKVLNILLKNAYDTLDTERYHTIRLNEIRTLIGWTGKNYNSLKKSLNKLVSTRVEWNIFKKDKKNEWAISSLLASASISGGKCIYDYSHHLKTLLKNPNIYGRINLITQNKFKSKYSLILWEFLSDYLSVGKSSGIRTEWIKIDDYKNFLGAEPGKYKTFKGLSLNLIKLPVEEINKVSDLNVEATYQKSSNKVVAVKFLVSKKKESIDTIQSQQPKQIQQDLEDKIRNELKNFCKLSDVVASGILNKYPRDQITANLEYIKAEQAKGNIKNLPAYSLNAIQNNFQYEIEIVESEDSKIERKIREEKRRDEEEKRKNRAKNFDQNHPLFKQKIIQEFGEKWFSNIKIFDVTAKELTIAAPSKFERDWIIREFIETKKLNSFITANFPQISETKIISEA